MNINFYFILTALCTSTCIHASQIAQKETAERQHHVTQLELQMMEDAATGRLTETTLQHYLKQGADINAKDNDGYTALIWASRNGHTAVVQQLIAAGADINAKDNDGNTALMRASYYGHPTVVQQLIAAGADINAKNNYGNTPLILASANGHTAVVQPLIAAGADINAKNNHGHTALILASANGHIAVVQQLIATGADINAKNNYGNTPLMLASFNCHTAVVQQLIAAGADHTIVNEKDNNKTARDYAKDKAIYDGAVAAGLQERKKLEEEYLARKPQAKEIIAERATHVPGLQDIIMGYAYGPTPLDLPPSKPDEEEEKSDD